uniref:ABC transporter domain-containing protein n=1 Tax=Ditylenchus dipsaci TaxID=166011 RepID=A0A915ELH1_9BILA
MELKWSIKNVRSKDDDRMVLSAIDGIANAGKIYAILGPADSGKSDLFDVLAEKKSDFKIDGTFQINGASVSRDEFSKHINIVVFDNLTECRQIVFQFLKDSTVTEGSDPDEASVNLTIKTLVWDEKSSKMVKDLSNEEKKCLVIARSLLSAHEVVWFNSLCLDLSSPFVSSIVKMFDSKKPEFHARDTDNQIFVALFDNAESGFSQDEIEIIGNPEKVAFVAGRIGYVVDIPEFLQFKKAKWGQEENNVLFIYAEVKPGTVVPEEMRHPNTLQ